jgi:hypothetical protein
MYSGSGELEAPDNDEDEEQSTLKGKNIIAFIYVKQNCLPLKPKDLNIFM